MEGGTKIAVIVILVVIIVGGGVFVVKRIIGGEPKQPKEVLGRLVEKMDSESLESVTLPFGKWKRLGYKDGKYKNPNTGDYTMVPPAICAACGEKIPKPGMELSPKPGADATDVAEAAQARMDRIKAAKCPKCGELAAPSGAVMRPERAPAPSR